MNEMEARPQIDVTLTAGPTVDVEIAPAAEIRGPVSALLWNDASALASRVSPGRTSAPAATSEDKLLPAGIRRITTIQSQVRPSSPLIRSRSR